MKKILVIDDEPFITDLLTTILQGADYEVKTAASGEDALALFHSFSPQLIITDIVMPGMTGIDLIMAIKKIDTSVKIIAISGGGFVEAERYLTLANALESNMCFKKPLNTSEILATVRTLIGT